MIVITSIFVAEASQGEPVTFEQLERANENDREEDTVRELIGLYKGENRVLPIE